MQTGRDGRLAYRVISRIIGIVALGFLIAGCDQCGDWRWRPDQSQSCKDRLPLQP